MTRLLAEHIEENKGKYHTIFLANGFQVHGTLLDSDEVHIKLRTTDYGSMKSILISHSAISTIIPSNLK